MSRPDFVKQFYKFAHKDIFCAVFRRAYFAGVEFSFSPFFQQIDMVVHFEPPRSAINPLAQLAAAADIFINECAEDIDDGFFIAEFYFRRPADKFLP